jgi:DNA-binding response OmpR family regulator
MANEKILIVEDEELVARLIRMSLVKYGYDVPPFASTSEQALRAVHENKPDLVLMDIGLPGEMDGIELAREVRFGAEVPVIFLSGRTDGATIERAKAAEPLGYLFKPFDPRNLQTTIDTSLHQFRAAQRRQREALQQAESKYQSLFEKLADEAEIPITNASKNLRSLSDVFGRLTTALESYGRLGTTARIQPDLKREIEAVVSKADLPTLVTEAPKTIAQTFEQLRNLAAIVRSGD